MKVLLIAPAWVGDMVMAHALVQVLMQRRPGLEIHAVAPPATAPLGSRMPGIAAVHELPVAHGALGLRERRRLGLALRQEAFAAAYVLPNSFKSALVPWWAKVPKRIGWLGEARLGLLNDWRRLNPKRYPLMVQRFIALAHPPRARLRAPWPKPVLRADMRNRAALVARLTLQTDAPITVLCPGAAFGPAKRWPAEHFAALARSRMRAGRSVWLLGSPADRPIGAAIASQAPGVVDLTGRTSLPDAVDLLSLAEAVVTNDSGLMHAAVALAVKVVALFGATSPNFTPPLDPSAKVLALNLDCRPCFQRECPLGHHNCLRRLGPEEVAGALGSARV